MFVQSDKTVGAQDFVPYFHCIPSVVQPLGKFFCILVWESSVE